MKNLKIIFLLLTAILWISCEKALELQPSESLSTEEALGDLPSLRTALYGVYHTLQSPDYYGQKYWLYAELEANLVYLRASPINPFLSGFYTLQLSPDKTPSEVWNACYRAINKASNIIQHVDGVKGAQAEKDQIKGEALALRAMAHFDLVRYFAKQYSNPSSNPADDPGVPIVLESGKANIHRNRVAEVYDQVINDLETARPLLQDQHPDYPYRFSPDAVDALLARVSLYMGDYVKAKELSGSLIESGRYSLANNVDSMFALPGSSEEIFTLKFEGSEDAGAGNLGYNYNLIPEGQHVAVSLDLLAEYDSADTRLAFIKKHSDGEYYQSKFLSQDDVPGLHSPKLLRLAEMYLIRAEARYLGSGDIEDARDDLNALRQARSAPELTSLNGIGDILSERHRELAFEGHTLFDYSRTGTTMVRTMCNKPGVQQLGGPCEVPANSPLAVQPIPRHEADLGMEQNEGY